MMVRYIKELEHNKKTKVTVLKLSNYRSLFWNRFMDRFYTYSRFKLKTRVRLLTKKRKCSGKIVSDAKLKCFW